MHYVTQANYCCIFCVWKFIVVLAIGLTMVDTSNTTWNNLNKILVKIGVNITVMKVIIYKSWYEMLR
jgi:hypothetical protein